jgi:phosphoribosyl 1,2-cyclic phosphate phosphodiesterase
VARDFRVRLGSWEHFQFLEKVGLVRLVELRDGESVTLEGVRILPLRLAESYVYAFLFEEGGRRALIAPDELRGWQPPPEARGADLAVVPMGILEHDPLSGKRLIPAEHPILRSEATFAHTLDIVRALAAQRVLMTHIEEPDGITHDQLVELERHLEEQGLPIRFAYDTMMVEV